jgi:hypothetical protein
MDAGKMKDLEQRVTTMIMVAMFELSLEEQERASLTQGIRSHLATWSEPYSQGAAGHHLLGFDVDSVTTLLCPNIRVTAVALLIEFIASN